MMTETVKLADAGEVVVDLVRTINANRQYLSEVDHGINMSKGFTQCGEHMAARGAMPSLPVALGDLSTALMEGIGGSMGPLYGTFFLGMSDAFADHIELDKALFYRALTDGIASVQEIGEAKVGDKTLIDTLVPARIAYESALKADKSFRECLNAMVAAAEAGMNSTRDLRARVGRAARLGDRSIGVLDAGACSCFLILCSMGESITRLLNSATSASSGATASVQTD
jgi:dihydroxyacetone kinase